MNIMNKVTLKGLLKNKTRTIVTIIGVILSTSMITAVTTFVSSLQNYVINFTIADEGDWHGAFYGIDEKDYSSIKDNDKIEEVALTRNVGYAMLEGSTNKYKPYLKILEIDEQALDILPIKMVEGRLPNNKYEVLVSDHTYTNGGVKYSVGDELSLDTGDRVLEDGRIITNNELYIDENQEIIESLDIKDSRTYTVVGISKRLSYEFEPYSDPGYAIITKIDMDDIESTKFNAYLKVKSPGSVMSLVEKLAHDYGIDKFGYNTELLRYMGISNDNSFNKVLYSLGSILVALIMVGSISLIYNSFSISLSERVKQFGLLSSVGATAKQRRNSVLFESLIIAVIGIPIGVLAGILGIGTTLYLLRSQLTSFLPSDYSITLTLSVSVASVISAVLIALITILVSASIPARRSKKISAMDAIRQTTDIKLTSKKVKTSKLARKLFGLEGDLALKNLKRNRRRYRSTVISLFISVVLFVSASAFGTYLKDSVTNVYEDVDYDLYYYSYQYHNDKKKEAIDKDVYQDILALEGIKEGSVIKAMNESTKLGKEYINEVHYNNMIEYEGINDGEGLNVMVDIYSVDHDSYLEYLDRLEIEEDQISNSDKASAIIIDNQHFYNSIEKRYNNIKLLKDESLDSLVLEYTEGDDQTKEIEIEISAFADTAPFGVNDYTYNNGLMLIIDDSQLHTSFPELSNRWYGEMMYFSAKDPIKSGDDIKEILSDEGMPINIFNIAEELQSTRNIITIITVFSYGFVILISLITIANVFNTISTNVNLRRREFAMLKSVGMTNRSFNIMLNFECIFYGLKALLYGLPVSIAVTYLIYRGVDNGVDMPFYLPSNSILISILSVFIVVFISMIYSMSKIRKDNILDGLKNENL